MTSTSTPAPALNGVIGPMICKAACDILRFAYKRKQLPMFSKLAVQRDAQLQGVSINTWPEIIDAIERFDWVIGQNPKTGAPEIVYVPRTKPVQLLALTERAFRRTYREVGVKDDLLLPKVEGSNEAKFEIKTVDPKDELDQLAKAPYDDAARTIAGRFIAQNTGKKTAGYGSVEIANGKLAWRWFETIDRRVGRDRLKATAVEGALKGANLLPPARSKLTSSPAHGDGAQFSF